MSDVLLFLGLEVSSQTAKWIPVILVLLAMLFAARRWLPGWKNGLLGESWVWVKYDGPVTLFPTLRFRGDLWAPRREQSWRCHGEARKHKNRRVGRREEQFLKLRSELKEEIKLEKEQGDAPAAAEGAPRPQGSQLAVVAAADKAA